MRVSRRHFLYSLGVGCLSYTFPAFAAWLKPAFEAKEVESVQQQLFPQRVAQESNAIQILISEQVENGRLVPVTVQTDLKNVQSICFIAEKNPMPLVAQFMLSPRMLAYVSARIKMAKSSHLWVYVQTDNQLFFAKKWVEITVGGCNNS